MSIRTTDGTEIRNTPAGFVATHGNRELHISAKSVVQVQKAQALLAKHSFSRLYSAAKSSPIKNTRHIRIAA